MDLAMNPPRNAAGPIGFASWLVARGILKQNPGQLPCPRHEHKLSAASLFTMFYNILLPLVATSQPIDPSFTNIAVMTRSIAYEALLNTFAVLHGKCTRLPGGLVSNLGPRQNVMLHKFPIFVAGLINTIGPVHFDGVPSRGVHVPYLLPDEVFAQIPRSYAASHIAKFNRKLSRSRVYDLLGVHISFGVSSAWWTLHAYPDLDGTTKTYSLWSPVRADRCDPALKLGALFAKSRLTNSPGIVNFNSTPFYDIDDPPCLDKFPSEIFSYPYFNALQPVYYRHVDRSAARDETDSASHHSQVPSKIRKSELPDGSIIKVEDDVVRHRVIYYYFDHRAASNIGDMELNEWSIYLNSVCVLI